LPALQEIPSRLGMTIGDYGEMGRVGDKRKWRVGVFICIYNNCVFK